MHLGAQERERALLGRVGAVLCQQPQHALLGHACEVDAVAQHKAKAGGAVGQVRRVGALHGLCGPSRTGRGGGAQARGELHLEGGGKAGGGRGADVGRVVPASRPARTAALKRLSAACAG